MKNNDIWNAFVKTYLQIPDFVRGYLPFFTYDIIRRKTPNDTKTILNIGCGKGKYDKFVKRKGVLLYGIDAWLPSVKMAIKSGVYEKVIYGDGLVKIKEIKDKSYDVVMSVWSIEHFKKSRAKNLIKEMERVAKRQVIIATVNGFFKQDSFIETHDDKKNPYEEHKSGCYENLLLSKSYKINGLDGWKALRNKSTLGLKGDGLIAHTAYLILNMLSSFVTYFYWSEAPLFLAVKDVTK